jgi:glutamate-1-semialdehyde aminotransferase
MPRSTRWETARSSRRRRCDCGGRYPAQITGAGSIFHLHMPERPIHDYRKAYAAPTEVRALRQLQQRMLRRGCLISPAGTGFISTVTPRGVIDGFAAALFDVLAAMERLGSA